jgi:hypothetical protein
LHRESISQIHGPRPQGQAKRTWLSDDTPSDQPRAMDNQPFGSRYKKYREEKIPMKRRFQEAGCSIVAFGQIVEF